MASKPLISILMTAYNRQQFIADAIESVLHSTYQNWELIIVDDCSKDDTVSIAKSYETKDSRIKVYVNEKNLGDYPNRNRAAGYAKGTFIQYLDSDDMIMDFTLEKMIELANNYPDVKLFTCSTNDYIDFVDKDVSLNRHFFEKQFLYYGPGGTFINLEFFRKMGGYPEKYGPANDMYFNLKAAGNTSIVTHPYITIHYRIHDAQESKNELAYLIQNFRYMHDALNELPLPFAEKTIKWMQKKNKRRFIVNLFNFAKKDKSPKNIKIAWKEAGFNFQYFVSGIFN